MAVVLLMKVLQSTCKLHEESSGGCQSELAALPDVVVKLSSSQGLKYHDCKDLLFLGPLLDNATVVNFMELNDVRVSLDLRNHMRIVHDDSSLLVFDLAALKVHFHCPEGVITNHLA